MDYSSVISVIYLIGLGLTQARLLVNLKSDSIGLKLK
jgi:hypothetical protein